MKNLTIYQLRKNGYKVRVNHYRYLSPLQHIEPLNELIPIRDIREKNLQNFINAKGGETVLEITDKNGKEFLATAKCSKKDSFNRKIAISICLGRFYDQISMEERIELVHKLNL